MKSWIEHKGKHINLATADSIYEVGPQGALGYHIWHGERVSSVLIEDGPKDEMEGKLTIIRVWLFDGRIR